MVLNTVDSYIGDSDFYIYGHFEEPGIAAATALTYGPPGSGFSHITRPFPEKVHYALEHELALEAVILALNWAIKTHALPPGPRGRVNFRIFSQSFFIVSRMNNLAELMDRAWKYLGNESGLVGELSEVFGNECEVNIGYRDLFQNAFNLESCLKLVGPVEYILVPEHENLDAVSQVNFCLYLMRSGLARPPIQPPSLQVTQVEDVHRQEEQTMLLDFVANHTREVAQAWLLEKTRLSNSESQYGRQARQAWQVEEARQVEREVEQARWAEQVNQFFLRKAESERARWAEQIRLAVLSSQTQQFP